MLAVRSAHNDESIDEQGITAGSIPATAIQIAVMGNEKVRSIPDTGSALFVVVNGGADRQTVEKR